MRRRGMGLVLLLASALAACGGEGLCIGTGGVIDVCKELFTREECAEYDDQAVNGSDWEFARGSCEARGFTVECYPHDWVRSEDADVCD